MGDTGVKGEQRSPTCTYLGLQRRVLARLSALGGSVLEARAVPSARTVRNHLPLARARLVHGDTRVALLTLVRAGPHAAFPRLALGEPHRTCTASRSDLTCVPGRVHAASTRARHEQRAQQQQHEPRRRPHRCSRSSPSRFCRGSFAIPTQVFWHCLVYQQCGRMPDRLPVLAGADSVRVGI